MDSREEHRQQYNEILPRLDERTKILTQDMHEIKKKLDMNYVTLAEFRPVRLLVFGFVGLVLTAIVGALIALVLK